MALNLINVFFIKTVFCFVYSCILQNCSTASGFTSIPPVFNEKCYIELCKERMWGLHNGWLQG